jgi:hypothetical protein
MNKSLRFEIWRMFMKKLIRTVQAKSEDGKTWKLFAYAKMMAVDHMGGSGAIQGRLASWETEDGEAVNVLDDENFQIVSTGQVLKRLT